MKITVDTDILVRAVVCDDPEQAAVATRLLREAAVIAVPLACLCEFVWVLRRVYDFGQSEVHAALRAWLDAENVAVTRPAADAGLAMLDAGGDFADGIIAFEGKWLGGEIFVSFDRKAVAVLAELGREARVPG